MWTDEDGTFISRARDGTRKTDGRDSNVHEGTAEHVTAMPRQEAQESDCYLWSIFPSPLKTGARMELECHHRKKMTNCFQLEMNSALIDCYAVHGRQEQVRHQNRARQGQLLRERIRVSWSLVDAMGRSFLQNTPQETRYLWPPPQLSTPCYIALSICPYFLL